MHIYLKERICGQSLVDPDIINPIQNHEDPPHSVDQGHHGPDGGREQRQPTNEILRKYLKRQEEQVRRGRPDGVIVPSSEPTEDVREREEQPHGGAQHDVGSEHGAPVEDLSAGGVGGGGGGGGGEGGEREAGEGEDVEGGEYWEGHVEEGDEAAGGEDHDEGDQLELDHAEGAHHPAHHRLLLSPGWGWGWISHGGLGGWVGAGGHGEGDA